MDRAVHHQHSWSSCQCGSFAPVGASEGSTPEAIQRTMRVGHVPVLVAEVAYAFATMPIPLRRLADCTIGAGGHSSSLVRTLKPSAPCDKLAVSLRLTNAGDLLGDRFEGVTGFFFFLGGSSSSSSLLLLS